MIWFVIFVGISVAYFVAKALAPSTAKIATKLDEIEANTRPSDQETSDLKKSCPRCGETVKGAAIICRFCGHEFDEASIVKPVSVVLIEVGPNGSLLPDILMKTGLAKNHDEAADMIIDAPTVLMKQSSPERAIQITALFADKGAKVELMDSGSAEALIANKSAQAKASANGCAVIFLIVCAAIVLALVAFMLNG